MIKILAHSLREYKKASIATPLLVSMEVVMECIIPFLIAQLVNQIKGGCELSVIAKYGLVLVIMAALSLMAAGVTESSAQIRFGVMGGATFSKMSKEVIKGENMTQFHAGGTVQLRLPLGFSLQPSLIYNVKGSRFGLIDDPVTPDDGWRHLACSRFERIHGRHMHLAELRIRWYRSSIAKYSEI